MAATRKPTERTVRRLFAVSGNRCAFRRCTTALVQGETVVGEVCHIKAANPGGPRYDPEQTDTDRHGFANLILMCGVHHKVIDDDKEAYTVERLAQLKVAHEKTATPMDENFVGRAARLLIWQTVTSNHQSGGMTAHTVHAGSINFHPPQTPALGGKVPDWTIQELFVYLRPNISRTGPTSVWEEAGEDVLDKLSSGQLQAWGREIVRGATTSYLSLAPIDHTYWRRARFTYVFLLDGHERDLHATQRVLSPLPDLADLRVNRADAIRIWPHPLRERWNVEEISLALRYFNRASDQVTIGCTSVTLFDAHMEDTSDAVGAPFQELIAPAYILAEGVDAAFIRSLSWKPHELSFVDPNTNAEQLFILQGEPDASGHHGRVRFFVEQHAALLPRPVSADLIERAAARFGDRLNYIQASIDAPAVLAHGPKLIIQVIPTSAFNSRRTIDHAAPQLLAYHFMPDGYQKYDGRPRQEGWVWHQPPQPVAGLPNAVSQWHSRLDWNGYVEIVLTLDDADADGRVAAIRGYPLERYIVRTLDAVSEGYSKLGVRGPVILRVVLFGVMGAKLAKSTAGRTKGFDRPVVVTTWRSLLASGFAHCSIPCGARRAGPRGRHPMVGATGRDTPMPIRTNRRMHLHASARPQSNRGNISRH